MSNGVDRRDGLSGCRRPWGRRFGRGEPTLKVKALLGQGTEDPVHRKKQEKKPDRGDHAGEGWRGRGQGEIEEEVVRVGEEGVFGAEVRVNTARVGGKPA
jgi:hypothetical protein